VYVCELTLSELARTSLVSSSTRVTSGAIALAVIAVFFPGVVIVILKLKILHINHSYFQVVSSKYRANVNMYKQKAHAFFGMLQVVIEDDRNVLINNRKISSHMIVYISL